MKSREYVSREWLIEEYHRRHKGTPGGALKMIEEAPAADVQEVTHGKWVFDSECGITKCNNCKWSIEEYFTDPNTRKPYVYCPNCGAKMDLEE